MNKKYHFQSLSLALALCCAIPASYTYAAENFSIKPTIGPLFPRTIYSGETLFAYYTITNKTSSKRSNYMIRGLPNSVTQVTNPTNPNYCQNQITLEAGYSCTLLLNISKPVNSSFALCKGNSCTTADKPLRVKQSAFKSPGVAVGSYLDTTRTQFPMLVYSPDDAITGSYRIDNDPTTLPPGYTGTGVFNSVSCYGLICATGGRYNTAAAAQYPVLTTSEDGGHAWTYKIYNDPATLPPEYSNDGVFNSVNCSGLNCVAGGSYKVLGNTGVNTQYPLLASSHDGGHTWTYVIDNRPSTLPPGYSNGGVFNSVNCSGLNCVAGGNYRAGATTTAPQYPLLASSHDGGRTWTYVIDNSLSTLPPGYTGGGIFNSVNCSGLNCVVGGNYNSVGATGVNTQYPLLVTSQDGGHTWTYVIDNSPSTLPPGYSNGGVFNSVSCSGLTCASGGSYNAGAASSQYLLLTTSKDGGITWTYRIDNDTETLPPAFNKGSFGGVSCSGLGCIAGGNYTDTSGIQNPLLATNEQGTTDTWTYVIDNNPSTLPPDFKSFGRAGRVNCSGLNCVAGGSYNTTLTGNPPTTQYPLLTISKDGGITWTYVIDNTPITLPSGYWGGGGFNSTVISSFLAESSSFIYEAQSHHQMKIQH